MEPVKSTQKRRKSLFIAEIIIVVIALLSFTTVGVLAWTYYNRTLKNSGRTPKLNDANSRDVHTFTTDEVHRPSGTIVDLVQKASPAVVTVISKTESSSSLFSTEETSGTGTGFFITDDGLLITNEHVVCDSTKPEMLSVVTSENKSYSVKKVTVDAVQDIAILEVDTKSEKVPFLKFANPDSPLKVGEDVIAIGNPLGINPGSVTRGIISGLDRNITAQGSCKNRVTQKDYEGVIQTDAAINSGNSGGPLLDLSGNVVGVNSATSSGANNISYSVPFQRVLKLLDRYTKNNGTLTFPYLGVEYSMIDPNLAKAEDIPTGAYVRRLVSGSPAEKAGIQRGDIITKIGDKTLEFSLQATLNQYFEPNQKVKVEVFRSTRTSVLGDNAILDGKYITIEMVIGEK